MFQARAVRWQSQHGLKGDIRCWFKCDFYALDPTSERKEAAHPRRGGAEWDVPSLSAPQPLGTCSLKAISGLLGIVFHLGLFGGGVLKYGGSNQFKAGTCSSGSSRRDDPFSSGGLKALCAT